MQAYRPIAALLAILVVAATVAKTGLAADPTRDTGVGVHLAAGDDEGPFGGPRPPKERGKPATKCRTPVGTCELPKPPPLGSPCICTAPDGSVIKGKAE